MRLNSNKHVGSADRRAIGRGGERPPSEQSSHYQPLENTKGRRREAVWGRTLQKLNATAKSLTSLPRGLTSGGGAEPLLVGPLGTWTQTVYRSKLREDGDWFDPGADSLSWLGRPLLFHPHRTPAASPPRSSQSVTVLPGLKGGGKAPVHCGCQVLSTQHHLLSSHPPKSQRR